MLALQNAKSMSVSPYQTYQTYQKTQPDQSASDQSAFTLMEILGTVIVIFILATIAISSVQGLRKASLESNASRNSATLNSAVQAFDQAGGLMTAQVPMQVGSAEDELRVFCLLASQGKFNPITGGNFVAAYQRPIISENPDDFRSVWVSGVSSTSPAELKTAYRGASGARNATLEEKMHNGEIAPGHFVTVGPGLYAQANIPETAPGILKFSKDGTPCGDTLSEANQPGPTITPTAPPTTPPPPTLPPPPVTPTPPPGLNFGDLNIQPPHVLVAGSLLEDTNAGQTVPGPAGYRLPENDVVELSAAPNPTRNWGSPKYVWDSWRINSTPTGSNPYSVTVDGPINVIPVFRRQWEIAATLSNPGAGTLEAVVGQIGLNNEGDAYRLRVRTNPGYVVAAWNVNNTIRGGGELSGTVLSDIQASAITAAEARVVTSVVTTDGGNGGTATGPTGILYAGNSELVRLGILPPTATVTATPNTGYTLQGWSGDASGTEQSATVQIGNSNDPVTKYATATFEPSRYRLSISASATGNNNATARMQVIIRNLTTGETFQRGASAQGEAVYNRNGELVRYNEVQNQSTADIWVNHGDRVVIEWVASGHGDHLTIYRDGSELAKSTTGQVLDDRIYGDRVIANMRASTPLLIDLNQNGQPDLLAGPDWKKDRKTSQNPEHFRTFEMVPGETAQWEWIGSEDALLVWDPAQTGTVKDASQLFGSHTFNQLWTHGFEPLATLDKDGNGILEGEELTGLAIWQDKNTNAISDPGEVTPLEDVGITQLTVKAQVDGPNAMAKNGAVQNGRSLTVWDWWSHQQR